MKRVRGILTRAQRVSGGPLLVRGVVFVAAWTGLLLALPAAAVSSHTVLGITLVAVLPALGPGSRAVTVAMLAIVGCWMLDTLAFGTDVSVGRLTAVAGALYVTHAAASLAAVIPYDAIVDSQVLVRWAVRAVLVLGAAGVVTVVFLNVLPGMPASGPMVGLLVGLAAVTAAVALLARLGRQR